ncbi:FRG domain-containing protein [Kluyvera georgiana]|uniref:FRG domain-containing protein n=1 Tax=Kluyvera georgiana TaxID=73098 RepID=UPI003D99BA33
MTDIKLKTKKKRPRPSLRVTNVSDFVRHVVDWRLDGYPPTVFRGQRHYGWYSTPKIFRDDNDLYNSENFAVRDIVSLHPSEFESDKTMFDRLVRMQHFGLPTRLLDVTTNPLVALWFATEPSIDEDEFHGVIQALLIPQDRQRYYDSDRVSCMANIANLTKKQKEELAGCVKEAASIEQFNSEPIVDTLVFHIGMEKAHFRKVVNPDDLLRPVYVKPKMSNKRIIAQSGAFLLWGVIKDASKAGGNLRQDRIWIHEDDKVHIRKELELLGIHERTLFPEIDKSASFITDLYGASHRGRGVSSLL